MDQNPVALLVTALQGTSLAPVAVYLPIIVAIAAILAAILPQPVEGSPWLPARKLLDMLAFNMGNAKNTPQAGKPGTGIVPSMVLVVAASVITSACSAQQNVTLTADAQATSQVVAADSRLACQLNADASTVLSSVEAAGVKPGASVNAAEVTAKNICNALVMPAPVQGP